MFQDFIIQTIGEIKWVECSLPNGSPFMLPDLTQIFAFILLLYVIKYLMKGLFSVVNTVTKGVL